MMFSMPTAPQGRLVGFEGSVKGRAFPLSTGTFVIGRGETCDMPLKDPGVSRQHAKIVAEGEQYILLDMESRNGTFVNGKPMRKTTLQEGDEVRICGAAFRFTFLDIGGSFVPPEMSLDDDTNETEIEGLDEDAPTDPHQRPDLTMPTVERVRPGRVATVTQSGVAPMPSASAPAAAGVSDELRVLKIVVVVALVAALIAVGAAVGVVMSLRRAPPPVVVEKRPTVVDAGTAAADPVVVDAGVAAVAVVVDAGSAREVVDAGVRATVREVRDAGVVVKRPDPGPKPVTPAGPSEWLPARAGPEIVRAPAAGPVSMVAAEAKVGADLVVIGGAAVKAPASGALSGAVKVGDTVRKGQIVARIAEGRVRADVPGALAKRAKKGAKVELQLDGGGTKMTTIDEVAGGTLFVEAGGAPVSAVRFP